MPFERYFDHAATTPPIPEVQQFVAEHWERLYANANSIHSPGQRAGAEIERARERVAALIGADDPSEIVFTSGATESNNWVLSNFDEIFVSPFEHSSVREPALSRGGIVLGGFAASPLPHPLSSATKSSVDEFGRAQERGDRTGALVSVMSVNNETGSRVDVPLDSYAGFHPETGGMGPGTPSPTLVGEGWGGGPGVPRPTKLHRDITQQVGKLPVDLTGVHYASFSAHKFGGLKGVGALYLRDGVTLEPLLRGGGQERGLRAGTLNVPGIIAMGIAAEVAMDRLDQRRLNVEDCRAAVLEHVETYLARPAPTGSPYILSLTFDDFEAQALVTVLDRMGFAVSSGAACSAASTETSPVLLAMGYPESQARATIRVSFGWSSEVEQSEALGKAIVRALDEVGDLG
ncbi:MAG: aminotransferase class V-fold PLP-dependent enzyme [Fimbriimonadaceae bacterium]|nr:aminotransferase class V-fold PLP-dependent enzyme [Fimbriimonadaceae bacterium]